MDASGVSRRYHEVSGAFMWSSGSSQGHFRKFQGVFGDPRRVLREIQGVLGGFHEISGVF